MDATALFSGTSIGSFIFGVAVGSVGTLFGVSIRNSKKISASENAVDQSRATAGGDIVGRDKRSS